ncbi:hypothetical protein NS337_07170 [Pseudomonas oryzihabitans]|uniref:hypothetical protein n=1 Tax=Pseudomonas oryzihabitans TaxID=47885 RepID=UPI0007369415|nr:hypothetical protein [Pseudomonas psychrotolerans]KTT55388.1 hypothetical protein NS337_07170 [Pseudomonas psychrotolerans]
MAHLWRSALLLLAALLLAVVGFLAWQRFWPAQAAPGWRYEVAHADIAKASALAWQGDALLTAEELKDGKGRLLRIDVQGRRSVLSEGLYKPDGLVPYQDGFAYSQEGGTHPIRWFDAAGSRDLFTGINAQGLWAEGKRLYAVEDRKGAGRLLRYDAADGSLTVLRDHLDEAESFTRCPDGSAFYTEKSRGLVRQLSDDGRDPPALREPSFLLCDRRGLWISEDSTHRARLLLWDRQSAPRAILTFLRAPQALLPRGDGYLLAEGGRDRIIALEPR